MKRLIRSFAYAFNGWLMYARERGNPRLHLWATVLVLISSILLPPDRSEWLILILCMVAVHAAEMFNSAIEQLCDFCQTETDSRIKRIKDLSAGAVMIIALGSLICALIIFIPKLG